MTTKKLHYISGISIAVFTGFHLFNHFYAIFGAAEHIALMTKLRFFYRNIFIETVLLLAVVIQIISGLILFRKKRNTAATAFEKLHAWTGLYLAIFLVIHVTAVFLGRLYFRLDTNFYFGVAGLNSFPLNLFFIPYYGLAVFSIFGHLASVHNSKMNRSIAGLPAARQAQAVVLFGLCFTLLILYGLTNHFKGVAIPKAYQVMIGK